jgi:hypothetical protein
LRLSSATEGTPVEPVIAAAVFCASARQSMTWGMLSADGSAIDGVVGTDGASGTSGARWSSGAGPAASGSGALGSETIVVVKLSVAGDRS